MFDFGVVERTLSDPTLGQIYPITSILQVDTYSQAYLLEIKTSALGFVQLEALDELLQNSAAGFIGSIFRPIMYYRVPYQSQSKVSK